MRSRRTRTGVTFLAVALLLVVGGVLGRAQQALAQETSAITGRVVGESTGQPLAGATVSVTPGGAGAITDAEGRFRIDVPPGKYSVEFSFTGNASAMRQVDVSSGPAEIQLTLRDDPRYAETIVVVGSRTPRSATKSPVPIDVITSEQIEEVGQIETNQVLRTVAPSYNASHQAISDGTDHVDPASLRGLGPDQTLVLLNGKRHHPSALVNVNGTFGRGTVGTDLNAIPTAAIERIEVLRDGASAQYGSDAIAGVVNIQLKEQPGVVEATALTGITAEGDGFQVKTALNYGIPVGKNGGVVNLTGEFLQRQPTDRAGTYDLGAGYDLPCRAKTDTVVAETPAECAARQMSRLPEGLSPEDISMKIGQSQANDGLVFENTRIPLGSDIEGYSTGGVSYRQGKATGFYRLPNALGQQSGNGNLFPNGFLPQIHTTILDWSASAGVRSDRDKEGFHWDASVNHGGNWFNFDIENSVNASLMDSDQTKFDAGGFSFSQTAANLDLVMPLDVGGAFKKFALNGGGEYRLENYRIHAGEPASYEFGERTFQTIDYLGNPVTNAMGNPVLGATVPGSQVFPGFQPGNEVDQYRNSAAGYVGLETELGDRLLVDLAGRFEDYDDFGSTLNGKAAARLSIIDQLAVRAAVSNGFRAPSLHQVFFNNTSTQFVFDATGSLQPSQVVTSANDDDLTALFGIPRLTEETSLNLSGGITVQPFENLSVTADAYRITIDNRVVLTSQFTTATPGAADLFPPNIGRAQFFANAVDTRTIGTDVVVDYSVDMAKGRFGLTGAANFTKTTVEHVNVPQGVADQFGQGNVEAVKKVILNREDENRLEDALPHQKGLVQARYAKGPVAGLIRANYYGEIVAKHPTDITQDEHFGGKTLFDADVSYEIANGFKVAVGGENVFNVYPDKQVNYGNTSNGQFQYSRRVSQFGMNGAFYYLRLQYFY